MKFIMSVELKENATKHHIPPELGNATDLKVPKSESRASNSSDQEADAELECLADNSASDDGNGYPETPADVAFARTRRQQQAVIDGIQKTKELGSTSIDLSQTQLQAFPDDLLELTNLEV